MICVEEFPGAPQGLVKPADRRAAVAGDEAAGVEAGGEIARALQHRQAHERLGAGHEGAAAIESVFIVERDLVEPGGSSGRSSAASPRKPVPERAAPTRGAKTRPCPAGMFRAISPANPDLRRRESEMRASEH